MSHAVPDAYLDKITLGGVTNIAVDQCGSFAFVQRSKMVNRSYSLYAGNMPIKVTRRRLWMLDTIPAGLVWCSGCGDFHEPTEFSKDSRTKSGYHSHCKKCRAKHGRIMYALEKESRLIHASKAIMRGRVDTVT